MSRPEHKAPPQIYYNKEEAKKYGYNSRILDIQTQLAERAYELLSIPEGVGCTLLDLGCGSGLSGEVKLSPLDYYCNSRTISHIFLRKIGLKKTKVLSNHGQSWIGMDISAYMLDVAQQREVDGDLMLGDMGEGLSFRTGVFDGAISISALQWLCNADTSTQKPAKRLRLLFETLYKCLARGSRAVFQFYPENSKQIDLITKQAFGAGFTGGVVIDYPNSAKAKKYYLCLICGGDPDYKVENGTAAEYQGTREHVHFESIEEFQSKKYSRKRAKKGGKQKKGGKSWIQNKKDSQRKKGMDVRHDSKYTGRRRNKKF